MAELAAPVVVAAVPAAQVGAVGAAVTESVMPQYGVSSWRSPCSMAPAYHRSPATATAPSPSLPILPIRHLACPHLDPRGPNSSSSTGLTRFHLGNCTAAPSERR